MRCAIAVFCLFAVTGCSLGSPSAPSPINREIVLSPGQPAPVASATVVITFLGVANDSRCPADALCVLGGSARVDVQATGAIGTRVVSFETGDPKPVRVGNLTLELLQLAPYPFSSTPIDPADYRATIRVTR